MARDPGLLDPTRRLPIFGWRGAIITLAIAVLLALVQASQLVWATASFGRPEPWSRALGGNLTETLLWAAMVPCIFALGRRFPLTQDAWRGRLAIHIAGALLVTTSYSVMHTALTDVFPAEFQPFRPARGGQPRDRAPKTESNNEAVGTPRGTGEAAAARFTPAFHERFGPTTFGRRVQGSIMRRASLHILIYAFILGIWHWVAQQFRLRERERQTQELSRQLADARLQALRMQLNPHFLFNTLNAIATLVHRDPRSADEMISCLSDFLRLTLNSGTAPESSLQKELEFARRYLDIEKVRFGDRLAIEEELSSACLAAAVPTLVLQPLLENAIRHGIEPHEQRGEIRLSAHRDEDELVLVVGNTGRGVDLSGNSRSGIGLANTRSRLRELYGERASLSLSHRAGGGLDVEIRIPWRSTAADANDPRAEA